ncbi:RNA polymerase sigma factor [Zeaxanthinibacter enoshimensis]|uniref:RNA polymerase sigma-70 factor (ECF subfamily) n=1 Tax=Zeaxanthinibacter enoshimensis TaxID=392009 RepID=A0A4R6TSF3_9FLAO|nr:sigma-70 family RNA polymerase sigma factor [Zeaxanthinibacter enoshimensis]TDQ31390.1 RNA polymerase sigma-70 factor (ECF subfamily) [Zeaxanthinibacter enoshimensis]
MTKEEAFVAIIQDHEGVIYKITTVYTNSVSEQQDLYQDIVYQLWKAYDSFRGESKVSTWMYRVALNTAFSRLRKENRRPRPVALDHVNIWPAETYDKEFELRLRAMYEQIHQLNDLDKGLILLLLEGKKYEEIAEITGLSRSNVGTRISRIKERLRKKMTKKT